MVETNMRMLAAAKEFKITQDSEACNSLLLFKKGGSLLPSWLSENSKRTSKEAFNQQLRARGINPQNPKGGGKGKPQPDIPAGKAKAKGKAKASPDGKNR